MGHSSARVDTQFNDCLREGNDFDFRNYRTLVHEAGHTLGLSNFDFKAPISDKPAHPSIPDAVMNYDDKVALLMGGTEPDCSPHPFDIMAIEALYQTIIP